METKRGMIRRKEGGYRKQSIWRRGPENSVRLGEDREARRKKMKERQ